MKFTDEQLTKIRESLSASGIPADVVEFTISDITAEEEAKKPEEETSQGDPTGNPEEGNPDDQSAENGNPEGTPAEEGNGEPAPAVEPVVEEVPPVSEGALPPQPEEVPPAPAAEPTPEATPQGYDDSELRGLVQELTSQVDEYKKANDGLLARIDSLEEALKKGGYLDDSGTTPVGDETPKAPAQVPVDEPIDDILAQINSHKY